MTMITTITSTDSFSKLPISPSSPIGRETRRARAPARQHPWKRHRRFADKNVFGSSTPPTAPAATRGGGTSPPPRREVAAESAEACDGRDPTGLPVAREGREGASGRGRSAPHPTDRAPADVPEGVRDGWVTRGACVPPLDRGRV